MKKSFQKIRKRIVMCMTAVMLVFAVSKVLPVNAGDFTSAETLPVNGAWSEKYELVEKTKDFYKFTISKAGSVDIKMMAYTPNLDLNLYDSNFNVIRGSSPVEGSETSPSTCSIVRWLSQGTYYVSVSSRFEKGGNYKLSASLYSSGITAVDQDSFDSPQNMRINRKIKGVMTHSNNEDWYKITVSSAGKYRYICQRSSESGIRSRLYDQNLQELSAVNFYYSNIESEEISLKTGTYYIKVEISRNGGGTYNCQLNEIIPAKGDILTDTKSQAKYKVTKAGRTGGTVTYQKSLKSGRTSITVPASVKIGNITYKVTGIASNACKGNSRLKKIVIGRNVVSIGANAFSKCIGLKSVTIPANVKSIGRQAFYNCKNLKTVTMKTTKLTSSKVGANAFKGIYKKAVIRVPKSRLSAYKSILKKRGAGKKVAYKRLL